MTKIGAFAGIGVTVFALAMTGAAVSAPRANSDSKMLSDETDGRNWAAFGRTNSEDHFSPLKDINDGNVGKLGLAWFYDLPATASVHTTPLAIDGTLYVVVSYSIVRAMDAKTGKVLWEFDPKAAEAAGMKLRGGWGVRGLAYWHGKIYTGTHDGRLIAIDAKTGKQVWSVLSTMPGDNRYITGAPRIMNGKVIIGFGGGDFTPERGYVTAYDAETGKQIWRFYTVPGDPKKGLEGPAMVKAAKTWTGEYWKIGGGGYVWNSIVCDPKFNRVYIGTGNGLPWNRHIRSPGGGDNLYVSSIVALDANTGAYVWHYQVNPGETWDYDANLDIEMANLKIGGKDRPVLMHAAKNGFFYVIDRRNGKLLSAGQYAKQNWAEGIDLKTGRPIEKPEARTPHDGAFAILPGSFGAHSTEPMTFSPVTGLMYIPAIEMAGVINEEGVDLAHWTPGPGMLINNGYTFAPPKEALKMPPPSSSLLAWDPVAAKPAWTVPLPDVVNGGATATAGNLVFQGLANGTFVAYAADTGKTLWTFDAQAGIVSPPIVYKADGKEYVTLVVGYGGNPGIFGAPLGWEFYSQKRRVLTFSLDGAAVLPPAVKHVKQFADDPAFKVDPAKATIGAQTFTDHCFLCHGWALASGGSAPDLRESQIALDKAAITDVLHNGSLVPLGMPKFDDLSDAQVDALQHYIRQQAREAKAAMGAPAAVAAHPTE